MTDPRGLLPDSASTIPGEAFLTRFGEERGDEDLR